MSDYKPQVAKPVRKTAFLGYASDVSPLADLLKSHHVHEVPTSQSVHASHIPFQPAVVPFPRHPIPVIRVMPLHKLDECVPEVHVAACGAEKIPTPVFP